MELNQSSLNLTIVVQREPFGVKLCEKLSWFLENNG